MANKQTNSDPDSTAEAREEVFWQLLASDLAVEVQAEFNGRRAVGLDVPSASAHVLSRFHPALSIPQEGPVVLVALAALQIREGHLQEVIANAALELIESGEALAAYRPADFAQRKSVAKLLEQFYEIIGKTPVIED